MSSTNEAPVSSPASPVATTPIKLAASGIPFIIAPTGTMGNNGAITLGTALATTYALAYIYLPAGALFTGSGAGWYFCQMSSTTVGVVYQNMYISGAPTIPSAPVAWVSTGPGAYTGVTGGITGPQITIPAGLLGPNGALRLSQLDSMNASANAKALSAFIGATSIWAATLSTTGQFGFASISTIYNRGAQNSNVTLAIGTPAGTGTAGAANNFTSINFAVAQVLSFNLNTGTATDLIVIESFLIEVFPGF